VGIHFLHFGVHRIDAVEGEHGSWRRKGRGPVVIVVARKLVVEGSSRFAFSPRIHVAQQDGRSGVEFGVMQERLDLTRARPVNQRKVCGDRSQAAIGVAKVRRKHASLFDTRMGDVEHRTTFDREA
jgi:hypothetical protein